MSNRIIQSLGRSNKSKLIKEFGFRNINEAIEHHLELYDPNFVKKRKYNDTVKELTYKLMRLEHNKIVEDIREGERVIKINIKKQKTIDNKRIKKDNLKSKIQQLKNPDFKNFHTFLKTYAGKSVVIEYIINKKVIKTKDYTIPDNFNRWFKEAAIDWWADSEVSIFDTNENKGSIFVYPRNENITTNK